MVLSRKADAVELKLAKEQLSAFSELLFRLADVHRAFELEQSRRLTVAL